MQQMSVCGRVVGIGLVVFNNNVSITVVFWVVLLLFFNRERELVLHGLGIPVTLEQN